MANDGLIEIPPPPNVHEGQYYFVYGEWIRVVKNSAVVTLDNPNPSDQVYQTKIGINEAIAMHPSVYSIMVQQARPGYTIRWSTPMSKDLYVWYKDVEQRIKAAMAAANGRPQP